jgi:hypothetical protein
MRILFAQDKVLDSVFLFLYNFTHSPSSLNVHHQFSHPFSATYFQSQLKTVSLLLSILRSSLFIHPIKTSCFQTPNTNPSSWFLSPPASSLSSLASPLRLLHRPTQLLAPRRHTPFSCWTPQKLSLTLSNMGPRS